MAFPIAGVTDFLRSHFTARMYFTPRSPDRASLIRVGSRIQKYAKVTPFSAVDKYDGRDGLSRMFLVPCQKFPTHLKKQRPSVDVLTKG